MPDDLNESGPFYTRSNGATVRVADMATPHLKSALAKLQREFPDHPEVPGMAGEVERRDAEYAAAQALQQPAGSPFE